MLKAQLATFDSASESISLESGSTSSRWQLNKTRRSIQGSWMRKWRLPAAQSEQAYPLLKVRAAGRTAPALSMPLLPCCRSITDGHRHVPVKLAL